MKADVGIITGTGLYALEGLADSQEVEIASRFGFARVTVGTLECRGGAFSLRSRGYYGEGGPSPPGIGRPQRASPTREGGGEDGGWGTRRIAHIPRHGAGHQLLPNMINYRANIFAMAELEVKCLLLTTAVGIVDGSLPLAKPILFDDLYFPENRLPDGSACTMHTEEGDPLRGHYIFAKPFSGSLRKAILEVCKKRGMELVDGGLYAQVNGPRFNSRAEIAFLNRLGVTAISQTAGIEVVLAGEMEIPVALVGFGVDYANGVKAEPTPEAVLRDNLSRGGEELTRLALALTAEADLDSVSFDQGFIYRF